MKYIIKLNIHMINLHNYKLVYKLSWIKIIKKMCTIFCATFIHGLVLCSQDLSHLLINTFTLCKFVLPNHYDFAIIFKWYKVIPFTFNFSLSTATKLLRVGKKT